MNMFKFAAFFMLMMTTHIDGQDYYNTGITCPEWWKTWYDNNCQSYSTPTIVSAHLPYYGSYSVYTPLPYYGSSSVYSSLPYYESSSFHSPLPYYGSLSAYMPSTIPNSSANETPIFIGKQLHSFSFNIKNSASSIKMSVIGIVVVGAMLFVVIL